MKECLNEKTKNKKSMLRNWHRANVELDTKYINETAIYREMAQSQREDFAIFPKVADFTIYASVYADFAPKT